MDNSVPVLHGDDFFRKNEKIYIHTSNTVPEYIGILHKHDCMEIVYVIHGKATHIINHKSVSVSKGDMLVIVPGDSHAFIRDGNTGLSRE